jgi:hypothetical protein
MPGIRGFYPEPRAGQANASESVNHGLKDPSLRYRN